MRKVLIAIGILAVGVTAYGGWSYYLWQRDHISYASQDALDALHSDPLTTVSDDEWLVFTPKTKIPTTAFILYPGGQCDYRGYAPVLRGIAEQGFLVIAVPMPFALAVLTPNKAEDVIVAYPEISHWVIGGHSLGGAMAAQYVSSHPGEIDGLLLWDAYSNESADISDWSLSTLQIHRSSSKEPYPESFKPLKKYLPANTELYPIVGGTHANFGSFAIAPGWEQPDNWNPPVSERITIDEQQRLIIEASVDFLVSVENGGHTLQ